MLSEIVIEAAKAEGLRIALLRVAYHRAGNGVRATDEQLRFVDGDVEAVLRDVDDLRSKYGHDPDVRIGIAPHSVRAVLPAWLKPLAEYAAAHSLPLHMHVAEQDREVRECQLETGRRPVELLAEQGVLGSRFVAVHATILEEHEARLLGVSKSRVCVCPTTERDLGDGLPNLTSLRAAQVGLCVGIDSHVITDPFEEMRALETHERLRTRSRITFRNEARTPAEQLWHEASLEGARACGFDDAGGHLLIDRAHPSLALVDSEQLLDAVVFSGSPALVQGVENA